jgi:hypothetical protein
MTPSDITKAVQHLEAAIALLKGAGSITETRNPEWFRDTGHLTDKGIEHLHSLFAEGRSVYHAAKELQISHRAASLRFAEWSKKQGSN